MMLRTKAFDGANVFMSRNLVPPEIFDALLDALKQNGAQVFLCCDPSRNGPNDFHIISSPDHEKFEDLRAKGCNLLGPQCVLSCGKENRALPKRGFTCCLAMDGTKALASGFDIAEKAKIEKLVTAMGGTLQTKTSLDISFVIVKNVLAAKYKWALNNLTKPIVTVNWLYQCWNEHRVVPQESFKVLPFSGLTISVTRLKADERKEIEKLIIQNGGKYSPELTKHCTHLISDAPEGDKYKVALRWGHIHIVTRRWFDQSVARRACLNEESYPVQGGSVSSSKTVRSSSTAQHSQEKCIGKSLSINSSVVTESNLTAFPCAGVSDSDLEATLSQNMSSMFSDPSVFIKEEDKAVPVLNTTNKKNFDCPVANDSVSEEDYLYLSECRISLVGFEASELRKLVNMIRNGGGSRYMSFNDKLTHIIIGKPSEIEKKGLRTLAASGVIHVVRTTWLEDCDREKKEVSVLRQHIAYDLLLPKESLGSIKGAASGISGLNYSKNSNVHHSVTSDNLPGTKETGNRMLSSQNKEEEPFIRTDEAAAGISGLNHSKKPNVHHSIPLDNLAGTKGTENRILSSLERNKEVEPSISTSGSIFRETMVGHSQQNLFSVVNDQKKSDKRMQSDPSVRKSERNTVFKGKTFCFLKSFPEHNRAEIVEWINEGGGMVVDEHVEQNVHFTINCHGTVPCAANISQSTCVSSHWIRSSLEAGCLQDVGSHIIYSPLRCHIPLPGFERFRFYVSQYDDKDKLLLRNLCVVLGAKFMGRLTKNTTHLLCKFASGSKYEAACKWGISPIRSEWIYECVNQNQIVPADLFRPKEVTSEDLEAGVCTVSQFPSQSFQISEGSSPQVTTQSQDLRNTTHARGVDSIRNEVQESRDSCKKARFSEIDVQEGMFSSRLELNHSNNAKRTGGNSSKGDGETSHGVSDVAAAIEDFLDLTSKKIRDQESPATTDCDRNLYSSNCSILGDDRGASHAVTGLSKPCHRTGKSDESSNPSKNLSIAVDGFSETQTESQVVGYEEDLSGRQMLIDRVRTRSSLV